ncbi:MAG: hemin uptake protein HemP [Burkholderiaceae bacterium]|nr:hemin uptake protein HemP [Burkholderiaceae bacterium]
MQATPPASPLPHRIADTAHPVDGTPAPGCTAPTPVAAVDSSALLQGQKAVAISHNGFVYRLQATKLGKLILTK